jgi:hypothetical protein
MKMELGRIYLQKETLTQASNKPGVSILGRFDESETHFLQIL